MSPTAMSSADSLVRVLLGSTPVRADMAVRAPDSARVRGDCDHASERRGAPASGTAPCCAVAVAQTAVSAVSPTASRGGLGWREDVVSPEVQWRVANPLAARRSNAAPISNRRYSRLATCATEQRFMENLHAKFVRAAAA